VTGAARRLGWLVIAANGAAIGAAVGAACGNPTEAAAPAPALRDAVPARELVPVGRDELCLTRGTLADRAISDPTWRGHVLRGGGDAAELTFTYQGDAADKRALAGGQSRRQLGVKLLGQDGCNVVYVMWRLDPKPRVDVSVKRNPGAKVHEECGARGYVKVKPARKATVPGLVRGATHVLRAELTGDELAAWIDGALVWHGRLPAAARGLTGPAGVRSDNVQFDLVELAVPAGGDDRADGRPACKRTHDD
jgi:hypothetical protein